MMRRRAVVVQLLATVAAGSRGQTSAAPLAAPNVAPISDTLVSSGQPSAAALGELAALGFGAVIYLAPPTVSDAVRDKAAIVLRQGLSFVNIPIRFDKPTAQDFDAFVVAMTAAIAAALAAERPRKVLVHCQVNFRGSAMVFLHRAIIGREPPEAAYEAVARVWSPDAVWKTYITAQLRRHGIGFEPY